MGQLGLGFILDVREGEGRDEQVRQITRLRLLIPLEFRSASGQLCETDCLGGVHLRLLHDISEDSQSRRGGLSELEIDAYELLGSLEEGDTEVTEIAWLFLDLGGKVLGDG